MLQLLQNLSHPLPFYVVMILCYALYKLDKIYPKVMADLEKREKNNVQ